MRIVSSVVEVNDKRKAAMADRVREALGGELHGKRVGVLGLTFKPNTDDMRDAPSLPLIKRLQEGGAEVVAFDPVGNEQAKPLLPGVTFADSGYAVAEGADALVLVTEWDELRGLDLKRLKAAMRGDQLIDLRNVYEEDEAARAGLNYRGIGRGEAPR
jgi:UDPglucose 6-dehydrogenase